MRKYKSSSKSNSSKTKYTINPKSKVIFEDSHTHGNHTTIFRLISDPKEPMYKYEYKGK